MQDLTGHWVGLAALSIFAIAYLVVVMEERIHLRKSIPVLIAAGAMWVLVGVHYAGIGEQTFAADAFRHSLLDFAELLLFLIVAMTYVNTMEERGVFSALRAWLVGRSLSLRGLFWITGALAFAISPIADNLTTALVMGAVVIAMGGENTRFFALACINVVVAANAGGAFSPFGDITTLMVWQEGHVAFTGFFALFLPALINWLVPAAIMATRIERLTPTAVDEKPILEPGALLVVALFLTTISMTVVLHSFLHLPPAAGMMLGLGLLNLYSYGFNLVSHRRGLSPNELDDVFAQPAMLADVADDNAPPGAESSVSRQPGRPLHIFRMLERVEWDTLMFFYGVILGVGALGTLGYLMLTSRALYEGLGPTASNVLVGVLSAVVDNVPVMFAVLEMNPDMPVGQWMLVTLTAGMGGSLLSIGSAAGA
jgi:Na+/H+ antiporter NhaD/arsenite permease-like protein